MQLIMMMLHFSGMPLIHMRIICSSESTSLCLGLEAGRSRLSISPFPKVCVPFDAMCLGDTNHRVPSWKKMMQGTENHFQAVPPGRRFLNRQAFLADISLHE